MAIQISGTTVIDNSRNLTNIESIAGNGIATQAEAEAGTNNNQVMTPLRVSQAISALASSGSVDGDINWSTCNVGCSVRGGGNVIYKQSNIIWIVAPSTAEDTSAWPMGYCNGEQGAGVYAAQRITGRTGWFIPDRGMMQTAYACRTYWDTYSTGFYWTSTDCNNSTAMQFRFSTGQCGNIGKNVNRLTRSMRVICYS